MRKSRFTELQASAILMPAAAGMKVGELCRRHGISDAADDNWNSGYADPAPEITAMKNLIAGKVLIGNAPFSAPALGHFFIGCFSLAFSAFHEFFAWWVAPAGDEAADVRPGARGSVWDTRSDIGCALVGALVAPRALARQAADANAMAAGPARGDDAAGTGAGPMRRPLLPGPRRRDGGCVL